jgi:hypothetical protein
MESDAKNTVAPQNLGSRSADPSLGVFWSVLVSSK